MAIVGITFSPIASERASRSMVSPLSPASSYMLSASVRGMPISMSWMVTRSPRLRFLASRTCRIVATSSFKRMSRVTLSSSLIGTRVFTPGLSITPQVSPRSRALPRATSTVVPG